MRSESLMLNDYIRRYKGASIAGAILMCVTALFMMFFPKAMMDMAVRVLAVGLMIDGLIHLVFYVMLDSEMRHYSNDLFTGVLALTAGLIIFMNVSYFVEMLVYLVAIWMLAKGLMGLQFSLRLIDVIEFNWIYLFIIGLLEVICSIVVIVHPFGFLDLLVRITGICLLVTEVFDIMTSIYVMRALEYSARRRIY